MKAIIPIAGLGTRSLPASKCIPKEMLPVFDRPVIDFVVQDLVDGGVDEVIFVVPPEGSITPSYFQPNARLNSLLSARGKTAVLRELRRVENIVRIATVVQDNPHGDGDAVLRTAKLVGDEPFLVYFGDEIIDAETPTAAQLLTAAGKRDHCVVGVCPVANADVSKFGIVAPRDTATVDCPFELAGMVEKPALADAPSNLALIGKYFCTPQIFTALRDCDNSADGELRLIDGLRLLAKTQPISAQVLHGRRFDVGQPQGLLEASQYFFSKLQG